VGLPQCQRFDLRNLIVSVLAITMTVACILWNIDTPTRLGFAILTEQYLAFQLGLAVTIAYLVFDARGDKKTSLGWADLVIAVVGFCILMYAAWSFSDLLLEQAYRPPGIVVIGAVVVATVMEGVRRRAGWTLFSIVAVFLIYALFADKVPGDLVGKALSPIGLVQYIGFDPSAAFSTPLTVGTVIVILFVFFGQLLFAAGGGAFFTDLAMAATGRSRGGSAKISVVASAFFGSISGSAVSNVVTTGVVTIPLMRRGGYNKIDAGAIEATASTGGQLTPPIMGAAAFLMAEFLEISYLAVASAALIPALLYYVSVFIQVDMIAARDQIQQVDSEVLSVREVLKAGWHFVFPVAVLLIAMFWLRYDPEDSALLSSIAIIIVGFTRGYRGDRLTLVKLREVFVKTGVSMVDLILIVAAAGFVIGVLNITGLGFALTLVLVEAIGSNIILILLVSAVICIFLGMGMPTSGVYVLLAALVAPSLVEAGINPIAAHLFILYFGMMSMITPPVALAAFAAAAIAKSNPLTTGLAAMRIGWSAFIIPFIYVGTPALIMQGTWQAIVWSTVLALTGVAAVSVGIVGFYKVRLKPGMRLAFIALGGLSFPLGLVPEAWARLNPVAAVVVIVLAITLTILHRRRLELKKIW